MRIHLLKTNMKKYIQVASFAPPTIEKELQALRDSIDKINTDADLEFFVRQNKTGQEIPEPFEYEPYQEVRVRVRSLSPSHSLSTLILSFELLFSLSPSLRSHAH